MRPAPKTEQGLKAASGTTGGLVRKITIIWFATRPEPYRTPRRQAALMILPIKNACAIPVRGTLILWLRQRRRVMWRGRRAIRAERLNICVCRQTAGRMWNATAAVSVRPAGAVRKNSMPPASHAARIVAALPTATGKTAFCMSMRSARANIATSAAQWVMKIWIITGVTAL